MSSRFSFSEPTAIRAIESQDFQVILEALRDLLIASEPYGRSDPHFCSAFHQARLVLVRHREHLE